MFSHSNHIPFHGVHKYGSAFGVYFRWGMSGGGKLAGEFLPTSWLKLEIYKYYDGFVDTYNHFGNLDI